MSNHFQSQLTHKKFGNVVKNTLFILSEQNNKITRNADLKGLYHEIYQI